MAAIAPSTAVELAAALLKKETASLEAERLGSGKFSETFLIRPAGARQSAPEAACDAASTQMADGTEAARSSEADVPGGESPQGNAPRRRTESAQRTDAVQAGTSAAEFILRIAPPDSLRQLFYEYRMMRQEPALHALIHERTTVKAPHILAHDFSRSRIDRDYLVMERLPGEPLSECASSLYGHQKNRIMRRLGSEVAQLHAVHHDRYGYVGPHEPMPPQTNWHDAFAIMWEKLLDDCVASGGYRPEDKAVAMRLWERHHHAFERDVPASLCHMDLWAANILVHEGEYSGLFDFDRACFGDAENDLAVAEYCNLTTDAFWEGYGRRPEQTDEYRVRRWFYLLYEHQKYIVIRISERHNSTAGAKRYADDCRECMADFLSTGVPRF